MSTIQPDAEYRAHLAAGRFMIQRSASTGQHVFYPRIMAPGSGAQDLQWVPASGRGTVYSTTVVRQRPPVASYNVALIDLEEGCRMMSKVIGVAPEEVRIGMRVQVKLIDEDGQTVVVFEAA